MKWATTPLGKVCEIVPGRHILETNHNRVQRGIPYLTGPSDFGLLQATASRWTEKPEVMCKPRDVLVTVKGAGVASLNFAPDETACIGRQLMAVRAREGVSNADYIYLALKSLTEELRAKSMGATVPGLSIEHLAKLPIPLVPLPEQKRIAARLREQLAEVAKAREALQSQLEAAEKIHAAALRAAFGENVQASWPKARLGDVANIAAGVTLGRKLPPGGVRKVPYLRVANVKDGRLDLSHVTATDAKETEIDHLRLRYGDLLLTEGGDPDKLGRGTFWRDELPECIHQNHVFRLRFDLAKFDPAFLAFQFGSEYGKAYFFAHAKQTTGIATINRKVLDQFPLLAPSLAIQQAAARKLTESLAGTQTLIADIKARLQAVEKMPAALLRQAFNQDESRT